MVFPDGDLLEPAFNQGFVEGFKVGTLLLNVILQVINSCKEEGLSISEFRVTLFFISYAVFCTARALISSRVRSVKVAIYS